MYLKKVLLVDDSAADRKLFTRELERAGFPVLATADPDDALAAIVSGEVGCVVTDQTMPLPGHELVKLVKGVRSDIGVVFLSGAELQVPVPPGSTAILKEDKKSLIDAVRECLESYRR